MKVCSTCRRCFGDRVESCTDQFHPPLSESIPGDPDMIDGYRLKLLLRSEFSVDMFRAKRTDSGPSCLIKIVSGDNVDRFLHQARTASAFFHPNVTDVYEAGMLSDGRGYLAMEEPRGRTIREMLEADESQPLLRSVEIVRQAAEALHAMHLAGLAHGAVNPQNIVVNLDGEILVRVHNPDLGSVTQRSIVSNKFLIDTALDSIRYFAPEQFSGEQACAQTDVYSLGVVFYEMLTGTPPFDAPTATALIHKLRTQSPPDIRITDFNLRMLVTHCLMESLQKQSRLRQVSADLFARQLRHIEQLATHTSTPPPAGVVPPQPVVVKSAATPAAVIIGPPVESNAPVHLEVKREAEPARPVVVEVPKSKPAPVKVLEELPVVMPAERPPIEKPLVAARVERLEAASPVELVPVQEELVVAPILVSQAENASQVAGIEKEPDEVLMTATPVEQTHDSRLHRSRLRRLKKKLHSMSADLVAHVNTAVEAPSILEPVIAESIPEPKVSAASIPEPAIVAESKTDSTAFATKKPIKIRFETPDDDIPSVAEVVEVLSKEASGEQTTVFQEPAIAEIVETSPPPAREPERVVALAARQEAMATERAISEPKPKPTVIANKKPVKIAIEIPDDDIPSVADVLEVLSKEASSEPTAQRPSIPQVVETPAPPVSEPKPVFAKAAAASTANREVPSVMVPAKRTEPKPGKVIETAPQPKVKSTSSPKKMVPIVPPPQRGSEQGVATARAIEPQDPDEITQVRPPARRIRIDLDRPPATRPAPRRAWKSEAAFTPTLLGKQKTRPTSNASSDSMFAAYYGDTGGVTSIPYRSLSTAVGVVALIMLFLFAGSSLSRYFQSAGSGDSSTTIASSTTQGTLPPIATQAKAEPVVVEQAATVPATSVEPERPEPPVSKPLKERQEEPAAEAKVAKNPVVDKKPAAATSASRAADTVAKKSNAVEPIKPSTIVIVKNRSSLLTRPRIVKDPKQ